MPHRVSPELAPATMPTMISKSTSHSGISPAPEDVEALLVTISNADNAQTALDTSYALTDLLMKSIGIRGLLSYGLIPEIKKMSADKKKAEKRESATFVLGAMFEKFPREQPLSEVVFLIVDGGLLNLCLDALADKVPAVREGAQYAVDELFKNMDVEAMVIGLLPALQ